MKKLHVRLEMQTTVERAWDIFYDQTFNEEMHRVIRLEDLKELEFEDTPDCRRVLYKVAVSRNFPDWVRKALGDVKASFILEDIYNKHAHEMVSKMKSDMFPNKVYGGGVWTVKEIRPGWVAREMSGELVVDFPIIGKKMEEKLAPALEQDYAAINALVAQWVEKDLEAQRNGQPLATMIPITSRH